MKETIKSFLKIPIMYLTPKYSVLPTSIAPEILQNRGKPSEHFASRMSQAHFISYSLQDYTLKTEKKLESIKVLDIGVRDGWSIDFLQSLGVKYPIGVELVPDFVNYAKSMGRNVVQSAGEHLPFDGNEFDVVLSRHTLEHAFNPILFIQEMVRCLKPEGVAYIVFPREWRPVGKHTTSIPSPWAFRRLLRHALLGKGDYQVELYTRSGASLSLFSNENELFCRLVRKQ